MKTHKYIEEIISICNMKHLSAEDIYLELKKKNPDIAKASVYRNIDKLVSSKKLNEIILKNNKKKFFEKDIGKHVHLVDQNGHIYDMPYPLNSCDFQIPNGFSIDKIDITIYGNYINK